MRRAATKTVFLNKQTHTHTQTHLFCEKSKACGQMCSSMEIRPLFVLPRSNIPVACVYPAPGWSMAPRHESANTHTNTHTHMYTQWSKRISDWHRDANGKRLGISAIAIVTVSWMSSPHGKMHRWEAHGRESERRGASNSAHLVHYSCVVWCDMEGSTSTHFRQISGVCCFFVLQCDDYPLKLSSRSYE